jgi:hypothetical protein
LQRQKLPSHLNSVIPSEVEESRCSTLRFRHGI